MTDKRVLIVSDIHYGNKNIEGSKRFIDFLSTFHDYDYLILLGDIFDFLWDSVEKRYGENKKLLEKISSLNKSTIFIPGNHDYWGKNTIRAHGFIYKSGGVVIKQGSKRFFLHHGDGFNLADIGYTALQSFSHSKLVLNILNFLFPPSFFKYILPKISRTDVFRPHSEFEVNYLEKQSYTIAKKYGFNGVVLGHSHFPIIRKERNITYANSGDWLVHFSYLILENGKIYGKNLKHRPYC
ncbi:metallophosphoesterase [bacterium]|nr:metallophosphoesterase [bacterium]